jgi:hypothetical protein
VLDSSGYVLYSSAASDILSPTPFVGNLYGNVAKGLFSSGLLVPSTCNNFNTTKVEKSFVLQGADTPQLISSSCEIVVSRVTSTNTFVVVFEGFSSCVTGTTCASAELECVQFSSTFAHCPCKDSMEYIECAGEFQVEDYPACVLGAPQYDFSATDGSTSSGDQTAIIIAGAVVGGLAGLVLLVFAVMACRKRNQKSGGGGGRAARPPRPQDGTILTQAPAVAVAVETPAPAPVPIPGPAPVVVVPPPKQPEADPYGDIPMAMTIEPEAPQGTACTGCGVALVFPPGVQKLGCECGMTNVAPE